MCGVAGLVWKTPNSETKAQGQTIISAMLKTMQHRGPDGDGCLIHERFALGHVRLSIIDINHGAQPMSNTEGDIHLSYNGEIYGFEEQRKRQKMKGWEFKTHSDTETLLAGYSQMGSEFDAKLNGMYAYAIADTRQGQRHIQLGIDPVGIKPLYLAKTKHAIIFASEMKAILTGVYALGEHPALNHNAISQYLTLGWVPAPRTMLKDVQKLEPGNRYRISLDNPDIQKLATRPYPEASKTPPSDLGIILEETMRRQVVSDAPLGFFLSGGIDSSLLVSTAQRIGIQPRTFTVRFIGDGHGVNAADESSIARLVANHCGSEHHQLSISAETLKSELGAAFSAMDQPIADPACLPLYVMSKFAREHVKVCLSGDGGDELFLGYPRHKLALYKKKWQRLPDFARKFAMQTAATLPSAPSKGLPEYMRKLRVGLELLDTPSFFSGPFSGQYASILDEKPHLPSWANNVPATSEKLFEADMIGQLAGQMLPKTDHITMAAGLEARVPFLDNAMISAARAVPMSEKIRNGTGKAPLRKLLAEHLPRKVTSQPKRGFRVPLTTWFQRDLAGIIREQLLDHNQPAAGLIRRHNIETMLDEHIGHSTEHSIRIWTLLALQQWLERLNTGPGPC